MLQFDLAVKWVKVNPRQSFEQTMIGRSPRCYIPSFVEIGPLVPEKIFEEFLNLKLTRTVRSNFVGQSAIHGKIFELFKASVTNSPIQKVVYYS